MTSIYAELALVALGAMLSPTTLSFSILALVLGDRPLRTGLWFYLGAFGVTVVIGVLAAFLIGNVAASPEPSTPKTWVAVIDVVVGVYLVAFVVRALRRPVNPERVAGMIAQMSRISSSPAIAVVSAGATLANPGGFIPLALKEISELNPSTAEYAGLWLLFAVVSLLPLETAIVIFAFAPQLGRRLLDAARDWIERRAKILAAVILSLLAVSLLSHGIAGLAS